MDAVGCLIRSATKVQPITMTLIPSFVSNTELKISFRPESRNIHFAFPIHFFIIFLRAIMLGIAVSGKVLEIVIANILPAV